MALERRSLFLYGFEISDSNSSLDFKTSALGAEIQATLKYGFYSLNSLMQEVVRAMNEADPSNNYTYSIARNFVGNTQNRVTISSNGAFLTLLFGSGSRVASSVGITLGYTPTDKTGATSYQSQGTAGTALTPELVGYSYLSPEMNRKILGSVNISASGEKEAIVFSVMKFMRVEFKFEPQTKVMVEWVPLVDWLIEQKLVEFTPDVDAPNDVFEGTLESTGADGKGLGWTWTEQLPDFPFYYRTGMITLRQRQV